MTIEEAKKAQEDLTRNLLKEVEGKATEIDKLAQMTALAKELGEDTSDADALLKTASDFMATIKKRLGNKK